ncbi:hypothetical protein BYT27DRAFT_7182991 [Phlegmacium glaucopus]|nr:hypothetical protein BYT27DRAFT_7182991 [Phlegmacium glaucopus]
MCFPICVPNVDDHGCSILSKLKAEADQFTGGASNGKKATVDTHRGDTYQFCYFIRKTEQHSVAIKSRNFRAIPQQERKLHMPISRRPSSKSRGKRKEMTADDALSTTATLKKKKRKTQNEAATQSKSTNTDIVDLDMDDISANDAEGRLQSSSKSGVDSGEIGTAEMTATTVIDLEADSEEEKPKPVLNLTYQGFNIYGQCLCVVVEPWPVVRSMTTSLSNSRRKTPVAEPALGLFQQRTSRYGDERTPLFLPDDLEEDEEDVEISGPQGQSSLTDGDSDSDEIGGMMEFSQVLRNIGDSRAGAANDDEDIDGSVLFGDADEFKEL